MELRVEYEQLNQFFADYSRNISQGGLFIQTEEPLETGKTLKLRIIAPDLGAPLVLNSTVRWVVTPNQATPEDPAGMGVEFAYDSDEERIDVEARIEALIVQTLGPIAFEALTGAKPRDP